MKAPLIALGAGLLLGACASPSRPQAAPGAQGPGVPRRTVDPSVVTDDPEARGDGAGAGAIRLPDRITIPAAYRLMLVDGHLALVRETDPQTLDPGPASLRVITGEIASGDLAYQPGLLPQELAAEVAANRESSARMDNALESVMQRSRELSDQAAALQAQAKKLGDLLTAAQVRAAAAEAAGKAGTPAPDAQERQVPGPLPPEQPSSPQN
jgi:hypothetical protein